MENKTFAEYILSEKDWIKKMEIMYYLNKRGNIFFDNSVVFKTQLLKLFLVHPAAVKCEIKLRRTAGFFGILQTLLKYKHLQKKEQNI